MSAAIAKAESDLRAVLSNPRQKPGMDKDQAMETAAAISRLVNAYVAIEMRHVRKSLRLTGRERQ
jgi:hypothetical protein